MLGQRAEELEPTTTACTVRTHRGLEVRAKAVIITGGIGTFTPRPLPDAEPYEGKGLRYFVPKLDELAGQDVADRRRRRLARSTGRSRSSRCARR